MLEEAAAVEDLEGALRGMDIAGIVEARTARQGHRRHPSIAGTDDARHPPVETTDRLVGNAG